MKIDDVTIGPNNQPFIIAEVAQSHDGSLGNAFSFIDIAKECGANAIKFQTHIASEESTPSEPWRVKFSRQDKTRYEYWKRMEFSKQDWIELKKYADSLGIVFLSSPFSLKACEWLEEAGMPAWKIASGETNNLQLIDWIIKTGKPIIISSGLSTLQETDLRLQSLQDKGCNVSLLHCTTHYPTSPDQVGMNVLEYFINKYPDIPIGLSDHSGTIYPGIVSTYLGGSIIEVHLTMHEKMFGPDVSSSLTPDQLKKLVQGANFAWKMRSKVDKEEQVAKLQVSKEIFGRSLVASRDLNLGDIITAEDILYKKPGGGLSFNEQEKILGKKVIRPIIMDQQFKYSDFE